MKIDNQQKVSKEELKDAIKGLEPLLDSHNSLIESFNSLADKNIDEANTQSQIKELDVSTGAAGITTANPIKFKTEMKVKVSGCAVLQCVEKSTFTPVEVNGCPAWEDINGEIIIKTMSGLAINKVYSIRFRLI